MLSFVLYTSLIWIALGFFFFIAGGIGVIRFPDFYSRLHPAGMLDSMGLLLSMGGLAFFVFCTGIHDNAFVFQISLHSFFTAAKIVLIVVFVYITSPTATHAIIDAGIRAGLKPWTSANKKGEKTP